MMSLTCSFSVARVAPNDRRLSTSSENMYREIDAITRKPPALPKRAMAMVGSTERLPAQDTAQLIAMTGTCCTPVVHNARAGSPCNGAAQAHAERHDGLAL